MPNTRDARHLVVEEPHVEAFPHQRTKTVDRFGLGELNGKAACTGKALTKLLRGQTVRVGSQQVAFPGSFEVVRKCHPAAHKIRKGTKQNEHTQ